MMTTTAETAPNTLTAAFEISQRIAAEMPLVIRAAASGRDRTIIDWTFNARVRMWNDGLSKEITISMEQNRVVSAEVSREHGNKVRRAIMEAWNAAGLLTGVKVRKHEGHVWRRSGDWHMGVFHTSGRWCLFIFP